MQNSAFAEGLLAFSAMLEFMLMQMINITVFSGSCCFVLLKQNLVFEFSSFPLHCYGCVNFQFQLVKCIFCFTCYGSKQFNTNPAPNFLPRVPSSNFNTETKTCSVPYSHCLSDTLPSLAPILSFSWPGRLIFLYERKTTVFSNQMINLMSFCPFPLKLLLTFPPFSLLFSVKCISVPQFDFPPQQIDFFYTWLFILYCGLGFMNVN